MRFILNFILSIPMMFMSNKIGNDRKVITRLLKFLSNNNIKSISIDLRHIRSDQKLEDIRKYINRFGSGISIVKNIEYRQTKSGRSVRYLKITLYKNLYTHEDILREALMPLLEHQVRKSKNNKIVHMNDYIIDKKLAVV